MDLQLQGRRALVTGSNSGIGKGIARMLLEEGAKVVIHGRNRERAEAVARELGAAGFIVGDLSTDAGADGAARDARAVLGGGVEILVNNAGGIGATDSTSRPFMDVTVAEWAAAYQNNTLAAVRMIHRLVPDMLAAKWGRVIQIASAVAVQPNNIGPDYSGAKAAMVNLSVSMAGSLKGVGVTVNTITPGVIMTPGMLTWGRKIAQSSGWGNPSDEELEKRIALERLNLPAGRIGRVEDIALMVCTLASPRSGFITGANFRIDGGQVRSIN
jgi:NAD(P)-dependent dehydrogenase (short-subunit alcohol dehydrogenase family)